MIKLKNISKTYTTNKGKQVKALDNINIEFDDKGMTFVLGKSGSGKTTLLNIIGCLDSYDTGTIEILGKDINDFKKQDFDFYRNTYIGFVFQDFNLLEEYNVFDNILLALKLRQKEINEKEIDELLEKLELKDLKFRKINELSGGQKQRVAIARALIKDPKIILADEPTGNLDSKTGKQVLDLLNEISKERLVIIISHDEKSANDYSDRIIRISDGKIIDDKRNEKIKSNKNKLKYNPINSKLPFKDCLKLGMSTLSNKKFKLLLTIFLSTISLVFLILSFSIYNYDLAKAHSKLIKDNEIPYLQIEKKRYLDNNEINGNYILNNDDLNIINSKISNNSYKIYEFSDNNSGKTLIDLLKINITITIESKYDAYTCANIYPEIIETDNINDILSEKIIGRNPIKSNEIVISNYIADLIIDNGITVSEKDEFGISKIFRPKNYEELINTNHSFYLGDFDNIKIVGIIDYDLTKFQFLRGKMTSKDFNENEKKIFPNLFYMANFLYNKIYTCTGFINELNNNDYNTLNNEYDYDIKSNTISFKDSKLYNIDFRYINNDIEYFNGKEWIKSNKLEKNEIILNTNYLSNFDETDYLNKLGEYLNNNSLEHTIENEKLFFEHYIDSSIIGKTVSLNISLNSNIKESFNNIKIIGITGLLSNNSNQILFSEELVKEYKSSTFKLTSILIPDINEKNSIKIFQDFPNYNTYSAKSPYTNDILVSLDIIAMLKKIFKYISLVFLIFTIVLISNFVYTSINYKKKTIGILRGLGTRQNDIIKIFICEGIIIAIATGILSTILYLISSIFLNNTIMSSSTNITPFIINIETIIFAFLAVIIIVIISNILPLLKFSKMKVVDVIYNK